MEKGLETLHVPLTKSTYKLLGEEEFKKMKNTAYVINTSRGAVIDTEALVKAVRENWIAGAGLDVLPQEPPDINDPLLSQENIVLTPHAAFCSVESLLDLQRTAANQVACVLQGKNLSILLIQKFWIIQSSEPLLNNKEGGYLEKMAFR